MELLINQVGYDCDGHKIALLQTAADVEISGLVRLRRLHDDRLLLEVPLQAAGQVPGWQGRAYWRADFSAFKEPGHYRLEAITAQGIVRSTRFAIGQDLLTSRCLSDVIHYFKGQRASGTFDRADRRARLFGTDQHKDVHGGWFDASGDMSKYLSHLSYANYLNPQQTPMVVWALLKCRELLAPRRDIDGVNLCKRLNDEALHGAAPTQGSELCTAVEMMYSLEEMAEITGDVQFADHLERVAFNALPTQATDAYDARQYYQQVNQVMITDHRRNFEQSHDGTDILYGLLTGYACCTSNMHQGWPKFTQNLWYATHDGGLAAMVYSPCNVTAEVAGGVRVTIAERTQYPFDEQIRFEIKIDGRKVKTAEFPLRLRIPGWCEGATVAVNVTRQVKALAPSRQ